ncbi:MAG: hypothetical protein M1821_002531 [Bathelium mastoideum]|nr:MAG: hypothetical protein M1821_002531 [Bathelium mastoideum]
MSFGWSVGDCFAALNFLIQVFSSLQDSGGSRSEYQELLRELNGLKTALQHIDTLRATGDTLSSRLIELKSITLACRVPLEHFVSKVKKYEKSLGSESSERRRIVKDTTRKIQWLGMKADVRRLQHDLNTHIGTINMLLAEFQLEYLNMTSEQACSDKQEIQSHLRAIQDAINATRTTTLVEKQDIISHLQTIQDKIKAAAARLSADKQDIDHRLHRLQAAVDTTTSKVVDAKADLERSTAAVRHNTSVLQNTLRILQRDFNCFCMPLVNILGNICTTTTQIYTILLQIRTSLPAPDPRFSYFQQQVKVEDALGRIFPVPSEYSFAELECIIRMKFENSPGYEEVVAGNYEISNRKNSKHILTGDDSTALLPGMSIVMAIVVDRMPSTPSTCPMPKCGSTHTAAVESGGRKCLACDVWFDQANRKRRLKDPIEIPPENTWSAKKVATSDEAEHSAEPARKKPRLGKTEAPRAHDETNEYDSDGEYDEYSSDEEIDADDSGTQCEVFKNVRCRERVHIDLSSFSRVLLEVAIYVCCCSPPILVVLHVTEYAQLTKKIGIKQAQLSRSDFQPKETR